MKKAKYFTWIFAIAVLFGSMITLSAQEEDTRARARESERSRESAKDKKATDEMKEKEIEIEMKQHELRQKQAQLEYFRQEEQIAKQAELAAKEMEYRARAMEFGDQNNSQLMLSKRYDGTDSDNTGIFSVEDGIRNIRLSIDGSVKKGSIKIQLILPDGKMFKEMTIDESADIRYSQSLNISEEQTKYIGNWKYRIQAYEAEGSYRMSINTH